MNEQEIKQAKQREYERESQWEQHPIETNPNEELNDEQIQAFKQREYELGQQYEDEQPHPIQKPSILHL